MECLLYLAWKKIKKKKLNRHIGWAAMYDEYTYQYLFTGL